MMRLPCLLLFCLWVACSTAQAEDITTRTVEYKKAGDRKLVMEIISPTAKSETPRPAIAFFHGGGWSGGNYGRFRVSARRYAKRGIVCALVQYRLVKSREPNNPPLHCIQDAKSAMRWVRSHAKELNVNPNMIAACGSSAGGHLSAAVTLLPGLDDPSDDKSVSPKANAMILFVPVLDNGPDGGYGHDRCGPDWKKYSPAHQEIKNAPPTLILAGREDHLARLPNLQRFQEKMKASGARCELNVYEGPHGFVNSKAHPGNKKKTAKDFNAFLKSIGWLK